AVDVSTKCFDQLFALYYIYFFFSSRRRHTRSKRDWSSDVCSSDLSTKDNTSSEIGKSPVSSTGNFLISQNLSIKVVLPLKSSCANAINVETICKSSSDSGAMSCLIHHSILCKKDIYDCVCSL